MKTPSILFSVAILLVPVRAVQADAATVRDKVGAFYGLFGLNSDGEAHFNGVCNAFLAQVPPDEQAEVLAEMLNQSLTAKQVDGSVLVDVMLFLQNLGKNIVWNQRLTDIVENLARTGDWRYRLSAVELLSTRNDPASRQIVISALNDPWSGIGDQALTSVSTWLDAIPTLQKYIEDHQSDPTFSRSIEPVTYALHGLQSKRTAQDYINHFYGVFNTPEGDMPTMQYPFGRDVPMQMQPEVLDQIMAKAISAKPSKDYVAIDNVLNYRTELALGSQKVPFSKGFDADVQTLASDSNYLLRRDVIYFLGMLKRPGDISLMLSALNDPEAEVRERAFQAIYRRDDAKGLFNQYIETHRSDPAYKVPVENVKSALAQFYGENQNTNGSVGTQPK